MIVWLDYYDSLVTKFTVNYAFECTDIALKIHQEALAAGALRSPSRPIAYNPLVVYWGTAQTSL
jgi:hypothetical protein